MATNPYTAPAARVADVDADKGLEVTWGKAFKVWWSLAWRVIVFGIVAGFVAGAVVGGIAGVAGVRPQVISQLSGLAGLIISVPLGIWVVKRVLQQFWADFRIVLLPR